jgi:hypothetical protein
LVSQHRKLRYIEPLFSTWVPSASVRSLTRFYQGVRVTPLLRAHKKVGGQGFYKRRCLELCGEQGGFFQLKEQEDFQGVRVIFEGNASWSVGKRKTYPHKNLHLNVHSNLSYNSHTEGTIQIFIKKMWCIHKMIYYLAIKLGKQFDTCYNMIECHA